MEMSQMVIQAMWQTDPVLLQLPHFTRDLAKKCAQANITTIIASQEEGSSLADMEVSVLCMLCCALHAVLCMLCCAVLGMLCFAQLGCGVLWYAATGLHSLWQCLLWVRLELAAKS